MYITLPKVANWFSMLKGVSNIACMAWVSGLSDVGVRSVGFGGAGFCGIVVPAKNMNHMSC